MPVKEEGTILIHTENIFPIIKKAEVKFENITKKFNETTAVDNVSCKFKAGT